MKMSSGRLNWIDNARGIAIILVVYRHVFEGLKNTSILSVAGNYQLLENLQITFFSFRMPLFFIITGVFIQRSIEKRIYSDWFKYKVSTILYPYFLWGSIQILIKIIFGSFVNSDVSWKSFSYLFYLPKEVDQFWYLLALFNISVLWITLKVKLKMSPLQGVALGFIMYILSAFISQQSIELGFVTDILHCFIYVALGDWISGSLRKGWLMNAIQSWKTFFIVLPLFVVSQYYFLQTNLDAFSISSNHLLTNVGSGIENIYKDFLYVEYFEPFKYLFIALLGCFFIFCFSYQLSKIKSNIFLSWFGKHSLYIYLLHVIVFAATRIFLMKVFHLTNVPLLMICCITAGLTGSIMIFKIVQHFKIGYIFSFEPVQQSNEKNA